MIKMLKKLAAPFSNLPPAINKKKLLSLKNQKLIIADVGAAGGLANRWGSIKERALFLTFDPQPEEKNPLVCSSERNEKKTFSIKNFDSGLWSSIEKKPLILTAYSQASSLYEHNHLFLNNFLNAPCHEVIGQETILLNTMENLIGQLMPDFIKIDAEGAELEILEGCKKFLKESTLGLELEVSFQERHKNAPFFGDVDAYLRRQGYQLMSLSRMHWVRKNNSFSAYSCPQLIWGNAVYMLNCESFFKKGADLEKFVLLLLTYRFHDYAFEIIQKAKETGAEGTDKLFKLVDSSHNHRGFHFFRVLTGIALASFFYLLLFPFPGIKKKGMNFIKAQLVHLSFLIGSSQRFDTYQSCVGDFEP